MNQRDSHDRIVSPKELGVGLWGGAVAWLAHLLFAYAIAEFGCVSPFRYLTFLGITAVAWLILIASLVTLVAAVVAAIFASHSRQRLQTQTHAGDRDHEYFLANLGFLASGLFAFIILVETVPIFYYLRDC